MSGATHLTAKTLTGLVTEALRHGRRVSRCIYTLEGFGMSTCKITREGDEWACHTHGTRWEVSGGDACQAPRFVFATGNPDALRAENAGRRYMAVDAADGNSWETPAESFTAMDAPGGRPQPVGRDEAMKQIEEILKND